MNHKLVNMSVRIFSSNKQNEKTGISALKTQFVGMSLVKPSSDPHPNVPYTTQIMHSTSARSSASKLSKQRWGYYRYLVEGHTCHRSKVHTSYYLFVGPVVHVTTALYSTYLKIDPI